MFANLDVSNKRLLKPTSHSRFSQSQRCGAIMMRIFVFCSRKCRQQLISSEITSSHHHIISVAVATHINRMSIRQFTWTWAKVSVVVAHLADQSQFNNAYSGQDKEEAYVRDIEYYNGHPVFSSMEVTRRHLHGKDGIYCRIYGHADTLRAQLMQNGREISLGQMNHKCFGISSVTMMRDGPAIFDSNKEEVFDFLISMSNMQHETTSNPARMTRFERVNHDKEGWLAVYRY